LKTKGHSLEQRNTQLWFRAAKPGEGHLLFDITHDSIKAFGSPHYSQSQIKNWMGTRTFNTYDNLIDKGAVTVAGVAAKVLGFVDAAPGEITRLFVRPDATGLGIGSKLLEIGIAEAQKRGNTQIQVESTLNAVAFYHHHGFEVVGTGHFSHTLDNDPVEIVLMRLNQQKTPISTN